MGKDCGSWLYGQKLSPWQSPNLNCGSGPPDSGPQNIIHPMPFPAYANPYARMDSSTRIIPGLVGSDVPELKSAGGNELQAWHCCYTRQTSSRIPQSTLEEKFSASRCSETAPNQKKFVVFDHSGNRTSLIFSSVGYPLQNPFAADLVPHRFDNFPTESPVNKDTIIPGSVKDSFWGGFNEHCPNDVSGGQGSEMHENTEEIDALLYSDEDDEETSTGHSPSKMTGYVGKEGAKEDSAGVASCSLTPIKRRRLEGVCDRSLEDTASSGKTWQHEEDAESSCIKGMIQGGRDGPSASKRLRRERIREAVGVLRSIIPGGKGKDATAVLDEAIRYLRSLRLKAKAL
ncbi:transcription factor bHLH143 [Magnolia sinica]|uniref:transcription factor bHLH143 n=1 Tax=Magnolia sinica TaxID=86752 RepID=UPI002659D7A4|nr:transcription factor bHLH143 [Magnolia sinica]XP_058087954.1 transcription factor bHLH143 [Magnolia sinica]XP_058087965.1 transcription factor bHLH143 [Magnolia sinica]